jgi:hypothetical protein
MLVQFLLELCLHDLDLLVTFNPSHIGASAVALGSITLGLRPTERAQLLLPLDHLRDCILRIFRLSMAHDCLESVFTQLKMSVLAENGTMNSVSSKFSDVRFGCVAHIPPMFARIMGDTSQAIPLAW